MKYYISLFFFFNFFSLIPLSIIINHTPNSHTFLQKLQITDTAIVARCTVEVELETIAQTYLMRAWQTQT